MTIRVNRNLAGCDIRPYLIPTSKVVTLGWAVKHSGADGSVENVAAVGDEGIGIALESGVAGQTVRIALFGKGRVPVKIGTAAVTRGNAIKYSADGGVVATIGGGTTKLFVWGQAEESGVLNDLVTCNLAMAGFTVGS